MLDYLCPSVLFRYTQNCFIGDFSYVKWVKQIQFSANGTSTRCVCLWSRMQICGATETKHQQEILLPPQKNLLLMSGIG